MTPAEWDDLVRAAPRPTYLQTTAWATVKRPNGWRPRLVAGNGGPSAQVLVRSVPVLPWSLGYAPRGPILPPGGSWSSESADAWTEAIRAASRGGGHLGGIGILRMDPELETDADGAGDIVARLRAAGWHPTRDVQPHRTRIIDLTVEEAALWSDLRKKWRQYVNRARSAGVVVRDVDADAEPGAFETFGTMMRETSLRAGIPVRATSAYRDLWAAFRPTGEAQLLFAEDTAGTVHAVLLLIRCGSRVTEPYGGMTHAGAELRANYLLKWEAIRRSRDAGATAYDLWGLPTGGIAHFKEGFGGREVTYVGAFDLQLHPVGGPGILAAEQARRVALRARRAVRGGASAPAAGAEVTE
jgi:peptidoglycan pentaglycine glycine transferase (the first glycine)